MPHLPRALAPTLGVAGAVGCALTFAATIELGLFSPQALDYLILLAAGLLGALIASRQRANGVAWLLIVASLTAVLLIGPTDYGYFAVAVTHGSWPLGGQALWLGSWSWAAHLGLFLPLLTVRFPDGRVPPGWRIVDVLAVAGTTLLALSLALAPAQTLGGFLPVSSAAAASVLRSSILSPQGLSLPETLGQARIAGMAFIALGYVAAIASFLARFRRSKGEERLQLKWFAFAGALIAAAMVYALVAWAVFGAAFGDALLPLDAAAFGLVLAVGIAILRYRLYAIDVIVNRTAVYAASTLLLVVVFGLANLALQRAAEALIGQHSDLVAAAVGVGAGLAFVPVRQRVRPVVDLILPSREVLTLLFTDIVGSTETLVDLGDARWRALLATYLATVRREVARFHGREVNTAGDAFFVVFSEPRDGLECARAIRAAVRGLGLEIRTGLHVGEVEMRGEEVTGVAVHTAARVMAAAEPGEILISESVRAALASSIAVEDRGLHRLKGLPGDWRLFALAGASAEID